MNALTVALFFLNESPKEDHDITHMKLQKLLYFAQGLSLGIFGKELFRDEIQAWKYGPVVPSVYEQFGRFGNKIIPIPKAAPEPEIDPQTREFLCDIFKVFGQYSAAKLSKVTHQEGPWKAKKEHYETISKGEMKTFFATKKDEFIDEVELIEDTDFANQFNPSPESALIQHEEIWRRLHS